MEVYGQFRHSAKGMTHTQGGTLILSSYVGLDQAFTVYPQNYPQNLHTPKIFNFSEIQDFEPKNWSK